MKQAPPKQTITHLVCMSTCFVVLMLFFDFLPDFVEIAFFVNLSIGMYRIRQQFAFRKVDLTLQCQTLEAAVKLCLLSVFWWVSEPLIKLQDQPKDL